MLLPNSVREAFVKALMTFKQDDDRVAIAVIEAWEESKKALASPPEIENPFTNKEKS